MFLLRQVVLLHCLPPACIHNGVVKISFLFFRFDHMGSEQRAAAGRRRWREKAGDVLGYLCCCVVGVASWDPPSWDTLPLPCGVAQICHQRGSGHFQHFLLLPSGACALVLSHVAHSSSPGEPGIPRQRQRMVSWEATEAAARPTFFHSPGRARPLAAHQNQKSSLFNRPVSGTCRGWSSLLQALWTAV